MNEFIVSGRLVADPESRYTQDGKLIYKFRFAVNRRSSKDHPETDFFNCVAFGFMAERLNKCNIVKGTKLGLIGEVRNSNYTDKNGTKHFEQQIVIEDFEFLEKKSDSAERQNRNEWKETNERQPFYDEGEQDDLNDDLPF